MILLLTAVTGVIDAVSVLTLGHVFVANMTGNIVFLGFAIARAPGFSLSSSLVALVAFLAGAAFAGWAMGRSAADRALLLRSFVLAEVLFIAAALAVAAGVGEPFGQAGEAVIAALLAVAMGLQNAVVRRIAVPDLTSTVLTMTLVGLAADASSFRIDAALLRRLSAVATMLLGALVGAVIVLHGSAVGALAVAVGLLVVAELALTLVARADAAWRRF